MKKEDRNGTNWVFLLILFLLFAAVTAQAAIPGIQGPTFDLTAKTGRITIDEGNSVLIWGFADAAVNNPHNGGRAQYPGPTLIVNQNANVTINLTNQLPVPISIVFPGQANVTASQGIPGFLTGEAPPGGTVSYSFIASEPGTYIYHSGTRPELQVEMGLFGALIVRPLGFDPAVKATWRAYNHDASAFDREYLHVLSEIEPRFHDMVLVGRMDQIDNTTAYPVYWFINGRAGFDTVAPVLDDAPYFPHQPYDGFVRMHPRERVLIRMIGAGRDLHPHHLHGAHHNVIARDGRLLRGPTDQDLSELAFTTSVAPGQTFDSIFTWTGDNIGWDVYGHADVDNQPTGNFPGPEDIDHNGDGILNCMDPTPEEAAVEDMTDHCKPIPVILPDSKELAFGPFWSGSPFLGTGGALPPGEGGFNPTSALFFMWHSHNEKELTSNNIFPGGMLTFGAVEHPSVVIEPTNP
jgi:hypothetical protein